MDFIPTSLYVPTHGRGRPSFDLVLLPSLLETQDRFYKPSKAMDSSELLDVQVVPKGPVANGEVEATMDAKTPLNSGDKNILLSNAELSGSRLHNIQLSDSQPSEHQLSSSQPSNPLHANPQLSNAQLSNPHLSDSKHSEHQLANPQLSNPQLSNTQPSNPQLSNPQATSHKGSLTKRKKYCLAIIFVVVVFISLQGIWKNARQQLGEEAD